MTDQEESALVWIEDVESGRLEREVFGYTPFEDVPESPYYVSRPGSWLSARAWLDDDGTHVVLAHDCSTERRVHVLRWPTWQAHGGGVTPSYDCADCGMHTIARIDWREVSPDALTPTPAPDDAEGKG